MFDLYLVANKTAEEKKEAIFLKMLVAHVKPNTVEFTEVMVFRQASRHERETASEFAKNCQFKELKAEILQLFVAEQRRRQPLQPNR
jgi:hypothetical protein